MTRTHIAFRCAATLIIVLGGCCSSNTALVAIEAGTALGEQCASYSEALGSLLDDLEADNPDADFGPLQDRIAEMVAIDGRLLETLRAAAEVTEIDRDVMRRLLDLLGRGDDE